MNRNTRKEHTWLLPLFSYGHLTMCLSTPGRFLEALVLFIVGRMRARREHCGLSYVFDVFISKHGQDASNSCRYRSASSKNLIFISSAAYYLVLRQRAIYSRFVSLSHRVRRKRAPPP